MAVDVYSATVGGDTTVTITKNGANNYAFDVYDQTTPKQITKTITALEVEAIKAIFAAAQE